MFIKAQGVALAHMISLSLFCKKKTAILQFKGKSGSSKEMTQKKTQKQNLRKSHGCFSVCQLADEVNSFDDGNESKLNALLKMYTTAQRK